jgi:hypothetical protein
MGTIVKKFPASLRDHVPHSINRILSLLTLPLFESFYAAGVDKAAVLKLRVVPEVWCNSQISAGSVPKLARVGDRSFGVVRGHFGSEVFKLLLAFQFHWVGSEVQLDLFA